METYQLKISLRGVSKPPVWRRIIIPANMLFSDLHCVIQTVMGWDDYHLYDFSNVLKNHEYRQKWCVTDLSKQDLDLDFDIEQQDADEVPVCKYLKEVGDELMYTYDFGDDWRHLVKLEKITDEKTPRITCLAGKGACPPEDVGGVWGYEKMKRTFAEEPKSEEADSYREWLGLEPEEDINSKEFNLEEVNDMLSAMFLPRESTDLKFRAYDLVDRIVKSGNPVLLNALEEFIKKEVEK